VDARDAALALAASSGNLATLLVGLAIATALWSGVQALNDHARKSYASAAAAVSAPMRAPLSRRVRPIRARPLYQAAPRRWKVSPVLEGTVRVGDKSCDSSASSR